MTVEISLREFLEQRFQFIESQLCTVRDALKEMTVDMITSQQFEASQQETAWLKEQLAELEDRLDEAEVQLRAVKWVAGTLGAVAVSVGVTWLKSVLGL